MKKIITVLLTPIFVLIQVLVGLIYPVSSEIAEVLDELFYDMYEFWKRVFKWKDGE